MKELPKKYDALEVEKKHQDNWENIGVYAWDETKAREDSFVIDTPPPTISGQLHMGHIFSYTQTDFVARYKRMQGFNIFYPMGFDDNGLPTERLVEKEKKKKAYQYQSREDFIQDCTQVSEKYRAEFRELFKSIALSVDWKQEYHTISDEVRKLSQLSFIDLYSKGLVERKLEPMFWDPVDQTAIAQAEIEEKELDSFENYIWFGLMNEEQQTKHANGEVITWEELEKVEIMTTRPELLPACVALMVHGDDAAKYKGKKAITPLFNAIVPIVADDDVQKDKGTGVVMCCTFGDEQDVTWWKRHGLELRVVLNKFGKLDFNNYNKPDFLNYSEANFEATKGKKADHQDPKLSAKKIVIGLLEENNLTANEKKPITHQVKCAERSGSPLEIIPTHQWFVKILEFKEQLKAKAKECNWKPDFMRVRIEQWIDSLSWDWCISRQRYFGVPFPVWYVEEQGTGISNQELVIADISELPANPISNLPQGFKLEENLEGEKLLASKDGKKYIITPDADVMDTWATSSISPQINSGAINDELEENNSCYQKLFPADLRPQAHEIIRTWAFYTIVKSLHHADEIPWENLMISGWCLAEDKTKMSKSKGNVVTPQEVLKEYSADVIRYWASTSKLGADTAFSRDVLKIGKKLVNKLWNATKFAAIHLNLVENPTTAKQSIEEGIIFEATDKWILSRLQKTILKATEEFELFEYSTARSLIEDFFWKYFCDNYLEIVKARVYSEDTDKQKARLSAAYTIYYCLNNLLKLFAPFVPHITEELYQAIFDTNDSIHSQNTWPNYDNFIYDEMSVKSGEALVSILEYVRKYKAEKNISIKFPIEKISINTDENTKKLIEILQLDLQNVTNSVALEFSDDSENFMTTENDIIKIKLDINQENKELCQTA